MSNPRLLASLFFHAGNWLRLPGCFLACYGLVLQLPAQTNAGSKPPATNNDNLLVMIQGTVEVAGAGRTIWTTGVLHQVLHPGYRVRTGEHSRAEIYLAGGMSIKKGEFSEFEVPPSTGVSFKRGIFEIFYRERDSRSEYRLPGATAAVRGTDFLVQVDADGRAELTVLDGLVVLSNGGGQIEVHNRAHAVEMNAASPMDNTK